MEETVSVLIWEDTMDMTFLLQVWVPSMLRGAEAGRRVFPALSSALQEAWRICFRPAWNPIPGALPSLELGVACPVGRRRGSPNTGFLNIAAHPFPGWRYMGEGG